MLSILRKENGNLSIVMLMAVIGMVSGLSMSSLVLRDFRNYTYEFENVQAKHLLRSDAYRGQNFLVSNPLTLNEVFVLPERRISVSSGRLVRSFKLRSFVEKTRENTLIGSSTGTVGTDDMDVFRLNTMVSTAVGSSFNNFDTNSTRVVLGSSLTLNQSSFAEFMYFTDQDTSPAGKNVYFWGPDVIEGKVHSNSDIQIKNGGGGNNGGWPTFLNLVTTTGHIVSFSGDYPEEDVFQGGLIEEYDSYVFPTEATTLKTNARIRFDGGDPQKRIYMLRVDQESANGMKGTVLEAYPESAIVWESYPPASGDSLFMNRYAVSDTLWMPISRSGLSNKGIWVDGILWIEGTFSGNQTWGASQNIYLIGDILLKATSPGQSPLSNPRDFVGLVSEKSILIKYGYKDPTDMVRHHPNMGADGSGGPGEGIYIYAALCALGDGGATDAAEPNFNHGVFTFEYQHPHGSTPAVKLQVGEELVLFENIDLHRYRFPPTSSDPWPIGPPFNANEPRLDYPWYNPLWPEAQPYLERGTINLFGAIAQRRRGFVHRSGNDTEYPSNDGIWDIPMDKCGGPATPPVPYVDPVISGLVLLPRNYPGAAGSGVGYKYKNYHFDYRFLNTQPIYYPEAQLTGGKKPVEHGSWRVIIPDKQRFDRYF
ncbi:MAG: hypothetical protein PHQ78_02060 [Candidatus Cloacimonetes bacterium]|jgi:hypothetical protein|nr:hypothetical protein [Candidatus Cloacimonadota bacterium]MDD2506083.1 hypothetical protein [Candidatus Cloacimonadota bacterium]MDD4559666.1 hypothetical protein [Candidatus Cloacimonadota bacterium]